MLRSMYSGISGMRGFQTKLDVIGNNIANVNTAGFKKGRMTFQDMMSQTSQGAQAAEGQRGGVNPIQVGLGSQIGSIDNVHTQGFLQSTGRGLDLAIEGDGFFVVNGGEGDKYTRTGNFYLDDNGDIVDENGNYLLQEGNNIQINIPGDAQSFSVAENGIVNYVDAGGNTVEAGRIRLVNFANPEGLEKVGGNLYHASANSGEPVDGVPGEEGLGSLKPGTLEMSNVELAEEFTEMIVSQRGFQANTRIITTSDEILQELVNLKR
ncbi:MAG TPA: flagellar basal body rod protein FlgG [Pseudogracilibacillus sp.]|nr:flagellar basal body rod protein FlgG [Pseudogracilibacillus sp.]